MNEWINFHDILPPEDIPVMCMIVGVEIGLEDKVYYETNIKRIGTYEYVGQEEDSGIEYGFWKIDGADFSIEIQPIVIFYRYLTEEEMDKYNDGRNIFEE